LSKHIVNINFHSVLTNIAQPKLYLENNFHTVHFAQDQSEILFFHIGIETIDENIFKLISSQFEILHLRNNQLVTENT